MSSLEIKEEIGSDGRVLRFSGRMTVGVGPLLAKFHPAAGEPWVFDFEHLTLVSSDGVRDWIEHFRAFAVRPSEFRRCPPMLIMIVNMIPEFRQGARIRSAYVDFYCPDCDRRKQELLETDRDVTREAGILTFPTCDLCSIEMLPAVPEDEYFQCFG